MEKVSNNDLISVIVPIYNVEKYLKRCVDSIINQTYKNLEIILVDDGSPDNCPKICDEYKKKDNRIKVIHKKNGGLSDARNVAIDIAQGQYLTFIDSDDYVESNYVEILYDTLKKYQVKLVIADNLIEYDNGKTICNSSYTDYVLTEKETLEKMLWGERDLDNGAWTKLYDKSLFKCIRYPVGRWYEDTATTYKIFDKCDRIAIISFPIYHYLKRSDSITQCKFNEKKLELIISTKEMTDFVRNKYPELSTACNRKLLWSYLSTLSQLATSTEKNIKIKKELIKYIKKNQKDVLKNPRTPKRDKIGIICLQFGFPIYKICWKLYLFLFSKKEF